MKYHLSEINTLPSDASARRVRHLLGVCASYKGHWHRALVWFISEIRTPVDDLQHLDRGDRAALYWLGDIYSLLNRKEEALLAYCFAGSCNHLANISMSSGPHRCLSGEQEQLRQTVSKETFGTIWADDSFRSGRAAEHSILHSNIVTQAVAQARLQSFGLKAGPCRLHSVEPCSSAPESEFDCISDCVLISPAHFESRSPWPMPLDPMFNMTNVAQGRLCTQENNFLELVEQGPERLQVRVRERCFWCLRIRRPPKGHRRFPPNSRNARDGLERNDRFHGCFLFGPLQRYSRQHRHNQLLQSGDQQDVALAWIRLSILLQQHQ